MLNSKLNFLFLAAFSLLVCSCEDDDSKNSVLEVPESYAFERNNESTVSFSGQTTRIAMATELVEAMKDFEKSDQELIEMFANETASGGDANPYIDAALNESTKSIRSKVAASTDFFSANTVESSLIKGDLQNWVLRQVSEIYPYKDQLAGIGTAGQVADGSSVRYVSAQGIEFDQAVNKALIGALMVDQICNNYLSPAVLDANANISENDLKTTEEGSPYTTMEHKWDEAYGYLFGFSADPANPLATLGDDSFLNKYLSRVEGDVDFTGIARDIFEAFKTGRAAIVAGEYDIRDDQAEIIRSALSEVIAIRSVYYLQQGKDALLNGSYGAAFHDLSEGLGFIYSLRFTRRSNSNESYFTKAEVDSFIETLVSGNGFWQLDAETLDDMSYNIAARFDFTVSQAAD